MSNENKICISCMNQVSANAAACPSCGYDGSTNNPEIGLKIGYRLNARYVVGALKVNDGDSVSYIGYDVSLAKKVEIREFLPVNGCSRDKESAALVPKQGAELHYKTSLMDFSDLFRNLKKLTYEDGIVKILDFFEENNTAYAVIEYFEAMTLREFLGIKSGLITWEQCNIIMEPIFNALNSIHSVNLIHRGVSPETIMISKDGEIKLSGFATTSVRTKGTDVVAKLFLGYSSPEQYSTTMWQSTAADVYGLAATIYRCITGTAPQEADQRRMYDNLAAPFEINSTIPMQISRAIMLAMLVDQNSRIQTVLGFKQMLSGEGGFAAERQIPTVQKTESFDTPDLSVQNDWNPEEDEKAAKLERTLKVVMVITAAFFVIMLLVYIVFGSVRNNLFGGTDDNAQLPIAVSSAKVPDYLGMSIDEAKKEFDVSRFNYVIEKRYSAEQQEGIIISQNPVADSSVAIGDTITLYINESYVVTMPDFEGLTKENAELLLLELGIDVSNYTFETEQTTQGYDKAVFKQSIAPNESFNVEKDHLLLTVAIHPKPDENE